MPIKSLMLFGIVLSGLIYNMSGYYRFVWISIWLIVPFLYILIQEKGLNQNRVVTAIALLFFVVAVVLTSFLYSADSFSISLSGASAEMLTPLLLIPGAFLLCANLELDRCRAETFIFRVLWVVALVLLLDFILRYLQHPVCSLNYSCRSAAKRGGVFINSNIVGQVSGGLLLVLGLVQVRARIFLGAIFVFLLIVSFSRAAWVAYIVALFFLMLFNLSSVYRYIFILCSITLGLLLIYLDPLNFAADGSGQSKLSFFMYAIESWENANVGNILFGFGASYDRIVTMMDINGWSPHASLVKSYLYYGVMGVIFYIFILVWHLSFDKRLFPVVLYVLVIGLSGAPIYWPSLTIFCFLYLLFARKGMAENGERS